MSATRSPEERVAGAKRQIAELETALGRAVKAFAAVAAETEDKWQRRQWERRAKRLKRAADIVGDLGEVDG